MDPTSTGFLTQLLSTFTGIFASGFGIITPRAQAILGTLGALEIALGALFWSLKGDNFSAPFLRKLLRIGFFTFLVASWPTLTQGVADGLAQIGAMAGGGSSAMVSDPSRILDQAFVVIKPIEDQINEIQKGSWMQKVAVLAVVVQYTIASLLILVAFTILAITCFLTYLEFFIVAVLGLILLPWGISNHTAFLAEKAIGAVIAQGVKLMVLSFIISVIGNVIGTFTLQPAPPVMDTWLAAASAFVLAILAVHAPAVAGGLLSGSPSLTAGSAAGVAMGAGAAALGAGLGGVALGRMAAGSAGKTITAAGRITEAGRTASTAAGAMGASMPGRAGAAAASATKEAGKVAATPVIRAGEAVKSRWDRGVQQYHEGASVTQLHREHGQFQSTPAPAPVSSGATADSAPAPSGSGTASAPTAASAPAASPATAQTTAAAGATTTAAPPPPPTGREQARQQRLEQGASRFKTAGTVVHAGTTAIKGLTTTHSGGSGNPTIRPTNDEA